MIERVVIFCRFSRLVCSMTILYILRINSRTAISIKGHGPYRNPVSNKSDVACNRSTEVVIFAIEFPTVEQISIPGRIRRLCSCEPLEHRLACYCTTAIAIKCNRVFRQNIATNLSTVERNPNITLLCKREFTVTPVVTIGLRSSRIEIIRSVASNRRGIPCQTGRRITHIHIKGVKCFVSDNRKSILISCFC